MAYLIVKGEWVITQNQDRPLIRDGAVAIRDRTIAAVGPAADVLAEYGAGASILNTKNGLVMPGLINSHTHVSMTAMRGLADDLPLMTWLLEHIFPAEAKMNGEMVYWGALLGAAEMIMSGTTSFCDMYLFEHEVARAVDRAGLRALLGEVLYDFPSANYGPPEEGLKFTERLVREYRDHELIDIAVEPHALYTCSPDLLTACRKLAHRLNVPLITHLAENRDEVEKITAAYGATPVRHLEKLGLLTPNLIADHCVMLDEMEIALLAERGVRVVHCPESNMKLASGVAPAPDLIDAGVRVALGTDGPASNNNLDMFGEMDTAAKLHKAWRLDPTVMDAETVLSMATDRGADVLGWEGRTGRLIKDYQADLIVIDLDQPHLTPLYHPTSQMVYAASGADVIHTIVGGRILMENRRLVTLDLEEIYDRIRWISKVMSRNMTKAVERVG
jgi:5-methylthioadenosine/S-adenosylhomocysteine deaminase